jgi:hypothetical protein
MKLTSLALLASFAIAGYVEAQTTPQEPATPPAESKPETPHQHPLSSACRKEVSKVCGSAHDKEMFSCVRDNLGTDRFSPGCRSELKEHAAQPAKPPS